jgi:hypothetical protein
VAATCARDHITVARIVQGLEPKSIRTRPSSHHELTPAVLDRSMNGDPVGEVSLVVIRGTTPAGTVIAGCRMIDLPYEAGRHSTEFDFTVEPDDQGQGIAG